MNKLKESVKNISIKSGIEYATLMAFIETESPMRGFQDGKLLIQFEPSWYKKKAPFAPSGLWSVNKVDVQSKEWIAFNNAFAINPTAAMESTSIGLPQIMGFHWKALGYNSVNEMWDDFKTGEEAQISALVKYITNDSRLYSALLRKDWHTVASRYNGAGYKELAKRIGREPYDITLSKNYNKYLQ